MCSVIIVFFFCKYNGKLMGIINENQKDWKYNVRIEYLNKS
jgi:hypothetical protein